MGTGMALISTLAVNNIMALCGSTGYPDQHGFGGGMALGNQYSYKLWPRPQEFVWLLMALWAMDINTDTAYGMVGLQTPTWSSSAVWARMIPWPQIVVQDTQIGMTPGSAWPLYTNLAVGVCPEPWH